LEPDFWHERWQQNEIGFHEREANTKLVANFDALSVLPNGRIFVPLCGKTRDIAWLLSSGHRVVGVELSDMAIQDLFRDLGVEPKITEQGPLTCYAAPDIDIYVGDIFDLPSETLGVVDAIYDRAALVALPEGLRDSYAAHVHAITGGAAQLLVCFDYDQAAMAPPPFSIPPAEVDRIHGLNYAISLLEKTEVEGGLKGFCPAHESCYLLKKPA